MDEADVCLLMIDAEKGLTAQDINIYNLACRKGKGIVLLVNKWDLVEKETNTAKEFEKELKQKLAPFNDVPVLFISAKKRPGFFKAVETALEVFENRRRKYLPRLNDTILKAIEKLSPACGAGHPVKIKFVTQLPTAVPLLLSCNFPMISSSRAIKLPGEPAPAAL